MTFDGDHRGAVASAGATKRALREVGQTAKAESGNVHKLGQEAHAAEHEIGRLSRGALAGTGIFKGFGRSIAFASGSFLGAAGIVGVLRSTVTEASKVQSTIRQTEAVFGQNAKAIEGWSHTTLKSLHLSSQETQALADTTGEFLKAVGLGPQAVTRYSKGLVTISSNLAAIKGANPTEVLGAIDNALKGRFGGLQQYGILIDKAAVAQEAQRLGLVKAIPETAKMKLADEQLAVAKAKVADALGKYGPRSTQYVTALEAEQRAELAHSKALAGKLPKLTAAERATATYSLVMQHSAEAERGAEKQSHTLAGQLDLLHASVAQVQEGVGLSLLPTINHYVTGAADWLSQTKNQEKVTTAVVGAVHGLVHAVEVAAPIVQGAAKDANAVAQALGGWETVIKGLIAIKAAKVISEIALAAARLAGAEALGGASLASGGLLANIKALSLIKGFDIPVTIGGLTIVAAAAAITGILEAKGDQGPGPPSDPHLGQYPGSKTPLLDSLSHDSSYPTGYSAAQQAIYTSYRRGKLTAAQAEAKLAAASLAPGTSRGDMRGAQTGGERLVSGKTGLITAGLASVEKFAGGRVLNDFATGGHATHSYHYLGEAADLAPDPAVWDRLFANRGKFAELFGPWGLYHYGVQFYDKNLQADHNNHIHVAYKGPATMFETGSDTPPVDPLSGSGALTVGHTGPKSKGLTAAGLTSLRGSIDATLKAIPSTLTPVEKTAVDHIRAIEKALHIHMSPEELARDRVELAKWRKVLTDEIRKTKDAAKAEAARAAQEFAHIKSQMAAAQSALEQEAARQFQIGFTEDQRLIERQLSEQWQATTTAFNRETSRGIADIQTNATREIAQLQRDFSRQMQAFDRETSAQVRALQDQGAAPTPAEAEIAALEEQLNQQSLADSLAQAQASGDPKQIAAANIQIRLDALQKQAVIERKARDDETQAAVDAYQLRRDDQRQALQDAETDREQARQDAAAAAAQGYQDARDAQWQALQDLHDDQSIHLAADLDQWGRWIQTKQKSWADFLDWLAAHGISTAGLADPQAGLGGAEAIAAAAQIAFDAAGGISSPGAASAARSAGMNAKYHLGGFARGGKIPGRYVGREDTLLARVTPGETVIDRRLTQALEQALAGGGLAGGPTVARLYLDGREFAEATATPTAQAQRRRITLNVQR